MQILMHVLYVHGMRARAHAMVRAMCTARARACTWVHAPAVEVRHAISAARCIHVSMELQQGDMHTVLPLRLEVLPRLTAVLGDDGELVRDARGREQGVEAGEL